MHDSPVQCERDMCSAMLLCICHIASHTPLRNNTCCMCVVLCMSVLVCGTVLPNTILYNTMLCNTVLCYARLQSTIFSKIITHIDKSMLRLLMFIPVEGSGHSEKQFRTPRAVPFSHNVRISLNTHLGRSTCHPPWDVGRLQQARACSRPHVAWKVHSSLRHRTRTH